MKRVEVLLGFWLIGYLAGKALHTPLLKDLLVDTENRVALLREKRLHRIITVAAAAANWHYYTHRKSEV